MKLIEKLKDEDIIGRVGKTIYIKEGVRFLHNNFTDEDDTKNESYPTQNTYLEEMSEEELLY